MGQLEQTHAHHREYGSHKHIGGGAEQLGAGAQAPQVDHHQQHQGHEAQGHPIGLQAMEIGGERRNARRRAHGHGEHVINREGGACHQARKIAQVFVGDPVGAPPQGIGLDGLAIANRHDDHQGNDQPRDRQGEAQAHGPGHAQHQHDFLGGIGHRGEGIGAQDGEGLSVGEPLFGVGAGGEGLADQRAA